MRIKTFLFLTLVLISTQGFSDKLATLARHVMPDTILIDSNQLYITEGYRVFIYSMSDFSLKKTFGRKGEGPREFKSKPEIDIKDDLLLVNSTAKVSLFSKTGTYIREVNNIVSGRNFRFFGNGFLGYYSGIEEDGIRYSGIYIYDAEFARIRSVYKYKSIAQSQAGKGWYLFQKTYIKPLVCGNKIVVAGGTEFKFDLFDDKGEKLFSVQRNYQRIKFTKAHEEKVLHLYKTRPSTAPDYEWWRKNIHFPDYFPAIRTIFTTDEAIYVRTYYNKPEGSEFFIFEGQGKLIKRAFLPIAESSAKNAYPFMNDSTPCTFWNGSLYQLILDEQTETWSLHTLQM